MGREAKIAILRWEQGLVPKGLMQLESMPGNSTNTSTYPFPVRLIEVPGACVETVINNPSEELLQNMISISKSLVEKEGICAITTSCGFNAIFQKNLADALDVPVLTSSLLQIPFVQNLIGKEKKIAVMTANKSALTETHFEACGVSCLENIVVIGLEEAREWGKIFTSPDREFDVAVVENEILTAVQIAVEENPDIGAVILECTDLPPFAKKISEKVQLPVFDFISMIGYAAIALGEVKLY